MGSGASSVAKSAVFKPSKKQRDRYARMSGKAAVCNAESNYYKLIIAKFDDNKSGHLCAEEVKLMMEAIMTDVTPEMGGVTDEDVDQVMRIGGDTVKPEITHKELPHALATLFAIKEENKRINDIFNKHDVDNSNSLPKHELKEFMRELNSGIIPTDKEVDFVLHQFDLDGDGAIGLPEMRAAIACWYSMASGETYIPETVEEAKTMGYSDEQIEKFVIEADELKDEEPSAEAPAAEVPAAEVPAAEVPAAEVPTAEAPTAEAPTAEAPAADARTAEARTAEAPASDAPAADTSEEVPAAETPAAEVSPVVEASASAADKA